MVKSASDSGERFWLKLKFGKRRNTLCLSSFSNCTVGAKDQVAATADLLIGCLIKEPGAKNRAGLQIRNYTPAFAVRTFSASEKSWPGS